MLIGGELFSVLRERSFFDDATARFYAACVGMHTLTLPFARPSSLMISSI
jgi:hypothetical protein